MKFLKRMELKNAKVDFQATGWVVEKDRPARFGALSRWFVNRVEGFGKNVASILERVYHKGENRVMVLTDYYQPKFQRVVNDNLVTALGRVGVGVHDDYKDTFTGFTKNGGRSWLYLVRGKEYFCREGHVLAVGTPTSLPAERSWYRHGPKLEDVLKFEKDQDAILIPSHPLSKFGFGVKAILLAIGEPSGTNLGLQENTIRKYADYFDALEDYSLSMDSKQTKRVQELARELKLSTVSNTDADLRSSFSTYNTFDLVDLTNPQKFRDSIRAGLKGEGNKHVEHRGEFVKSLRDKITHILLNVAQSREYF